MIQRSALKTVSNALARQAAVAIIGPETYVPDGGIVFYPRYTGTDGVEAFARRLVEESGIVVMPPSVYASALTPTPTDRFRMGYGRNNIEEGLAAMRAHLLRNYG